MTNRELIELARTEGAFAAVLPTGAVPVNGKFRKFCEENLCGKYNTSYSCPPDCGTVEEVHQRLLSEAQALVLEMIYEIDNIENAAATMGSEKDLNVVMARIMDKMRSAGLDGFCLGYGGCTLCVPCKQAEGTPCPFPERRISCMSAYCIDVAALAKECSLEFSWEPNKLHMFCMIAFHKKT